MKHIALFFLVLFFNFVAFAETKIVASYPPIQSLVWGITEGVSPVNVIFGRPLESHHDVQLKPSQMKILQNADLVFYASENLETFMPDALKAVAPKAKVIPLMETTPDLKLRPSVSNPEKTDVHFWLDVDNALLLLDRITQVMIEYDSKNADKYQANNKKAKKYLNSLKDAEKPPFDKRFVAFHDGFGYLADYFGLNIKTLDFDIENLDTPQMIRSFHQQTDKSSADCLLIEPEVTRRQIKALGLKDKPFVKMDAFGWNVNGGVGQYYRMMRWNLQALRSCGQKK